MGTLEGKVAVITGGNTGIGLATAKEFRRQGAKVVITGRNAQALEQAVEQLGGGDDVLAVAADVTRLDDLQQLFATAQQRFGGVDVVFANAGTAKIGPIEAMTEALFDEVMHTNLKGLFFTIQQALPVLKPNASIILNGSVNAHVGFPNASVYSASKAAVHSLARTLGAELIGRGIRVNTLNIGPINTDLFSKLGLPPEGLAQFAQAVGARVPLGRFGNPDEVAKAAVFLASSDSSFVVGSEVVTDGGLTINAL
jgi:NAD(P)-dependent dehydrogenase (short-subunit alcohol dehydrogenase family)